MARALFAAAATCLAVLIPLASRARAHPAWGVAVDRRGQVYFSDLKTVWKVDARGVLSVFRAAAGDRHTHDLNVDDDGNLYGADNSYEPATGRFVSAVWRMTPAGDFSYLLAPTDSPPKGTSIWRDRDGNTYHVTNYPGRELLVLKRSRGGGVSALVGGGRAAREYRQGVPYSVGGMAFGGDGALYFTHGANVSKVTAGGVLTALARGLAAENAAGNSVGTTQLLGIAVDARGDAFVADFGNGRVLKLTPDGKSSTVLRAEPPWFPTGVAAGDGGALYVLEEGHTRAYKPVGTRVRKLSPDGAVSVLATVGENTAPPASPPAAEALRAAKAEAAAAAGRSTPRVLIGAGAGLFPLAFVGWLVWRRRRERRRGDV